jgi:hypothetical protein
MQNSRFDKSFEVGRCDVSAKYKLPFIGKSRSTMSFSFWQIAFMHLICSPASMVGHFWFDGTPDACSIMMYSLPTVFEASSFQSNMFGMGIPVSACPRSFKALALQLLPSNRRDVDLHYLIVATSELVVDLKGPEKAKGSLATIRFALSV